MAEGVVGLLQKRGAYTRARTIHAACGHRRSRSLFALLFPGERLELHGERAMERGAGRAGGRCWQPLRGSSTGLSSPVVLHQDGIGRCHLTSLPPRTCPAVGLLMVLAVADALRERTATRLRLDVGL